MGYRSFSAGLLLVSTVGGFVTDRVPVPNTPYLVNCENAPGRSCQLRLPPVRLHQKTHPALSRSPAAAAVARLARNLGLTATVAASPSWKPPCSASNPASSDPRPLLCFFSFGASDVIPTPNHWRTRRHRGTTLWRVTVGCRGGGYRAHVGYGLPSRFDTLSFRCCCVHEQSGGGPSPVICRPSSTTPASTTGSRR